MLLLSLLLACDESDPSFQAYDPSAVEEEELYDMAPENEAASAERRRGSFGGSAQVVTLNPPPGNAWPVAGLTSRTMGRWIWPGARVGLLSGGAACRAIFAGSHMCSVDELLESESLGAFANLAPTEIWVADVAVNPNGGANDNCSAYAYEGAHLMWQGLAVAWRLNPVTGDRELMVNNRAGGQTDAACLRDLAACAGQVPSMSACNTARPIACCR
jgi:hypothetical protein